MNPEASAATTPRTIGHATVWFLLAKPHLLHLHHVPAGLPTELTVYHVPAWVMSVSHPLIVLVPLPLAVLVARRVLGGAAEPADELAREVLEAGEGAQRAVVADRPPRLLL